MKSVTTRAIRPLNRLSQLSQPLRCMQRGLATIAPVPPVTQDATSSKGPTAMVFMNMGGPSTTGEVGSFLSRLFVCDSSQIPLWYVANLSSVRRRFDTSWTTSKLPWTSDRSEKDIKDSKAICINWWRISYSKMVRTSSRRDVYDIGQGISRDGSA